MDEPDAELEDAAARLVDGRIEASLADREKKESHGKGRKEGRKSLRYTLLEAPFQSTGNRSSRKRTAQLEVSSMSGSCQFMPMQS